MEKEYWENYYRMHRNGQPETPFARDVLKYTKKNKSLIELGCGNGRDSVYFSKNGLKVIGIDQCKEEINYLNNKYSSDNLSFQQGDFTRMSKKNSYDYIYSRFTLHAVDEDAENRVLDWAYNSLNKGGLFFLELRSINDVLFEKGNKKGDGVSIIDHYRRFADFKKLENKLGENKFKIISSTESKGLAPYKDEDPMVIRFIGRK